MTNKTTATVATTTTTATPYDMVIVGGGMTGFGLAALAGEFSEWTFPPP